MNQVSISSLIETYENLPVSTVADYDTLTETAAYVDGYNLMHNKIINALRVLDNERDSTNALTVDSVREHLAAIRIDAQEFSDLSTMSAWFGGCVAANSNMLKCLE